MLKEIPFIQLGSYSDYSPIEGKSKNQVLLLSNKVSIKKINGAK